MKVVFRPENITKMHFSIWNIHAYKAKEKQNVYVYQCFILLADLNKVAEYLLYFLLAF